VITIYEIIPLCIKGSVTKIRRDNVTNVWIDTDTNPLFPNVFRVVRNKCIKYFMVANQTARLYAKDNKINFNIISKSYILYIVLNDLIQLSDFKMDKINSGHIQKIFNFSNKIQRSGFDSKNISLYRCLNQLKSYILKYKDVEPRIEKILEDIDYKFASYILTNKDYLSIHFDIDKEYALLRGEHNVVQCYRGA